MRFFDFYDWRLPMICLMLASLPARTLAAQCPIAPDSIGTGGRNLTWSVAVPGFENQPPWSNRTVFIHVPSSYQAGMATPVIFALHGTAGSPSAAIVQAANVLDRWKSASDAGGFIVVAPAAAGSLGSWIAPINETDIPSDYDLIGALIDRVEAEFSIDPTRRYLWGFSSGGHVALDVALNRFHRNLNADLFAGFGVHAGVTAGLACSGLSSLDCQQKVFAPAISRRPVDMHIGTGDPLWPRAQEDRSRFLGNDWIEGVTFFWRPFAGGHEVPSVQLREVWNNLCPFRSGGTKSPSVHSAVNPFQADSSRYSAPRSGPVARQRNTVSGLRHQDSQR